MSYSTNPADVLANLAERAGITLDQAKLARMRAYLDEPVLPFPPAVPLDIAKAAADHALRALKWPHGGPKLDPSLLDPEAEPGPHFSHGCVQVPVRGHEPRGPVLEAPFERFRLALDGVVCPSCNRHLTWDKLPAGNFMPVRLELFGRHSSNTPYPGELMARVTCSVYPHESAAGDPGCRMSSTVHCPVEWV